MRKQKLIEQKMKRMMKITVRGKKSARAVSSLEQETVERILVSSIVKTTAPLVNRAILPVSRLMIRLPTSNSSLKVSRNLVAGAPLAEEMVRRKEVWRCKVVRSDVALLIRRNAMDIGMIQRSPENGSAEKPFCN
jgi:hypothetical protein